MDILPDQTRSGAAIYRAADEMLQSRACGSPTLGQLLAPWPHTLEPARWQLRQDRFAVISTFFQVTLDLVTASMAGDASPEILALLLNDTPTSYGADYHRSLDRSLLTQPLFFRTDEAPDGTVYEIQCPGSGWGEYELLRDLYQTPGLCDAHEKTVPPSLADAFVDEVNHLGVGSSPVLHLIDNSSSPAGVRYFINRTRPRLTYYGWDAGARSLDCGLIRSHSVFGLLSENFAARRMAAAVESGLPLFDLPPHIVFDQKVPFVLPFWAVTRDSFPDEVRAMLPYTQLVTADGFELPDGTHITLDQFASLPKGQRRCYLKYAGTDVAWNWGSHAVSRLTKESAPRALAMLQDAAAATEAGHPWVLQFEHGEAEPVEWVDPTTGAMRDGVFNAKYSAFYGPRGLLGMSAWYRNESKVHSQADAVLRICVAPIGDVDGLPVG